MTLDLRTADPERVRAWQREQQAPETPLAARGARDGAPQIQVRGATVTSVASVRVSVVAYDVDGRPATLVAADEADVPPAPDRAWLRKRVYVHQPEGGRPALTWTTSGQTFAIVSDLSGAGQAACLVCHTRPAFKRSIDAAVARLAGVR